MVQKKTAEKDGYDAIQLGFQEVPERKLTKPELGHQKKAGLTAWTTSSLTTVTCTLPIWPAPSRPLAMWPGEEGRTHRV